MKEERPTLHQSTYVIEQEIGSGGGGVVYRAWHTRLQTHVVLKEIKGSHRLSTDVQRNEVEALKQVKSAYLPQVLDFFEENGKIYTAMEFICGESMDHCVAQGKPYAQSTVLKWYYQLATALSVIHRGKIYHRDVKPANIMLTATGDVCLIDFNTAMVEGNDVQIISRSLGYAAPEQYALFERFQNQKSGKEIGDTGADSVGTELSTETVLETANGTLSDVETVLVDGTACSEPLPSHPSRDEIDWERADIYSLGATIYHLLTGVRPPQQAQKIIPLSQMGNFSPAVIYCVERSMAIQPEARFPSVDALLRAITNCKQTDVRWRKARRKKIVAAILFPLLLAVTILVTFVGHQTMEQECQIQYFDYIQQINQGEDNAYEAAISLFPDRMEAYEAKASQLRNQGDYAGCIALILENMDTLQLAQQDEESRTQVAHLYDMLGCCYLEIGDQESLRLGKEAFLQAISLVQTEPNYYGDYAILLARSGDLEKAKQNLDVAQVVGLDQPSVDLLRGEIAMAEGAYEEALVHLLSAISTTKDDYLRYRAYCAGDTCHQMLGDMDGAVALLIEAETRVPPYCVSLCQMRLANLYAKMGDYEAGAQLYATLVMQANVSFQTYQNYVLCLQQLDRFEEAEAVLEEMAIQYDGWYQVPMYQAYLSADVQSTLKNEDRDYTATERYYEAAVALYQPSQQIDGEMEKLERLILELKQQKWLES